MINSKPGYLYVAIWGDQDQGNMEAYIDDVELLHIDNFDDASYQLFRSSAPISPGNHTLQLSNILDEESLNVIGFFTPILFSIDKEETIGPSGYTPQFLSITMSNATVSTLTNEIFSSVNQEYNILLAILNFNSHISGSNTKYSFEFLP